MAGSVKPGGAWPAAGGRMGPASPGRLQLGEVHVWRISLDEPPGGRTRGALDGRERARARGFYVARDRGRFVAARTALRDILATYAGMLPRELVFTSGAQGKPALAFPQRLRFNLSHANDLALCAVTWNRHVGIDVEWTGRRIDVDGISRRFFTAREHVLLMRLDGTDRRRAFFEGWTRKEAYLKALGTGLTVPLDRFDVALGPGCTPAVLSTRVPGDDGRRWRLCALHPAEDYVGTLAVDGHQWDLRCWAYRPGKMAATGGAACHRWP